MQNGVAKVLELSAQFSAVGRPHKKDVFNLKRCSWKETGRHQSDRHSLPGPPLSLIRVPTDRSTPERKPPGISRERTVDKYS